MLGFFTIAGLITAGFILGGPILGTLVCFGAIFLSAELSFEYGHLIGHGIRPAWLSQVLGGFLSCNLLLWPLLALLVFIHQPPLTLLLLITCYGGALPPAAYEFGYARNEMSPDGKLPSSSPLSQEVGRQGIIERVAEAAPSEVPVDAA